MRETLDRIDAFVYKIAASGYDTVQTNVIASALTRVKCDLTYLEISADDYKRAAADMLREDEALWRSDFEPGTRKLTAAEVALLEERIRLADVVDLRIDTMYLTSQRLLDDVVSAANTILSPTARRPRGVKDLGRHRTVRRVLEDRIREDTAPRASSSLFSAMDQVEAIKDYRDDHVAHSRPPTFPDRSPMLRIGPERHEVMADKSAKPHGDIRAVLDGYVNEWLAYLESVPLPFDWPRREGDTTTDRRPPTQAR